MKYLLALNLKLKQRVARRQIDTVGVSWIPPADDQATRIGIASYLVKQFPYLINSVTRRIVAPKRSPEITIHGSQIAGLAPKATRVLFISPFGPDVQAFRAQVSFVRVAG